MILGNGYGELVFLANIMRINIVVSKYCDPGWTNSLTDTPPLIYLAPNVGDRSIGSLPIDYFLGRLVVCAQCTRSVHDVQG